MDIYKCVILKPFKRYNYSVWILFYPEKSYVFLGCMVTHRAGVGMRRDNKISFFPFFGWGLIQVFFVCFFTDQIKKPWNVKLWHTKMLCPQPTGILYVLPTMVFASLFSKEKVQKLHFMAPHLKSNTFSNCCWGQKRDEFFRSEAHHRYTCLLPNKLNISYTVRFIKPYRNPVYNCTWSRYGSMKWAI